eukprot:gene21885-27101_t
MAANKKCENYHKWRFVASASISQGRSVLRDHMHDRLVRIFDDAIIVDGNVQADMRFVAKPPARKPRKSDHRHAEVARGG